MANWTNAPLIYTIGMVQFPRLPGVERFTDAFLDRVRSEYPLSEIVSMPQFNANFGPDGLQITQHESKMWQFLSIDRNWGFILNEQALCLHTVQYHDFPNFSERFRQGLNALLSIPDIGIAWTTALGMRYVDMVVAENGHLHDLLQDWILPAEPPNSTMTIVEGAYVVRYKTDLGELRLQSMRSPPFTLPPELQSPLIVKNKWSKERPVGEFALVDTDHGITYDQPKKLDVDEVVNSLDALHLMSKQVFESMGTPLAVNLWRGGK